MPKLLPGVTILSGPESWAIIPRRADGTAAIDLRLGADPGGTAAPWSVQARVVDERTQASPATACDWTTATPDGDAFTVRLDGIPTGGLYRIETRLRRPANGDRRAMRGDCIHHLGVGDLWLVAGQSNASGTGKGTVDDAPALGVHCFANDESWRLACHPLEDATGSLHPATITTVFHGHSPWLAFARRLLASTSIPVGLVPTAQGGSALSQWMNDDGSPGPLTLNLLDMAAKAGGHPAGVVWYQGESDAWCGGDATYGERFARFVAMLRGRLADPHLAVITVQLGSYTNGGEDVGRAWNRLREAQRQAARTLDRVFVVPALDVSLSDEIHNGACANVVIGERCASAALAAVHGRDVPHRFPEAVAASFADAGRTSISIRVEHRRGDWTPSAPIREYTVEDSAGPMPLAAVEIPSGGDPLLRLARPAQGATRVIIHAGCRPEVTLRDDDSRCLLGGTLPVV